MIFTRTIPPSFLIDSSLKCGSNSPWCECIRMRKSIIGVCKAWWKVGVELLYQEICIRRVGQIPALLRTLDSNNDIGNLIKTIEISCFIPSGYLSVFSADLGHIFNYCPRVAELTFAARAYDSPLHEAVLCCPALPMIQFEACVSLTRLEFIIPTDCGDIVSVLQVCVNLRSLWICVAFPDGPDKGRVMRSPISLARLETLRLTINESNEEHLPLLGSYWSMPSLRRVVIDELNDLANSASSAYRNDFFKAFGVRLRYLHIRPYRACGNTYLLDVQGFLDRCPVLEHLAICPSLRAPTPLTHPTVKWIDLWTSPKIQDMHYLTLRESLSPQAFPGLLGIRELDHGLSVMTDWPGILPPDAGLNEFGVEYRFPGVHVQYTARGIFKKDLVYFEDKMKPPDDGMSYQESEGYVTLPMAALSPSDEQDFEEDPEITDSDSDGSYVPDDASDDGYSSGDSEGFASEEDQETVDEMDHHTALLMFAQTLN